MLLRSASVEKQGREQVWLEGDDELWYGSWNISDVWVGLLKYNVPSILPSTKIMGLTFYINTVVHCWL